MIWFTSDLHLGHRAIVERGWRPFSSVEEMNRTLIDNWNDVVAPEDTIVVLGDVALGKTRETIQMVRELKGDKLLVPGNHDSCWHHHKRWRREVREYTAVGFTVFSLDWMEMMLEGLGYVSVSHFPYSGDHTETERYLDARPPDEGGLLLHGHVHGAWKVRGRQINIGVDVWDFAPVSLETLVALHGVE